MQCMSGLRLSVPVDTVQWRSFRLLACVRQVQLICLQNYESSPSISVRYSSPTTRSMVKVPHCFPIKTEQIMRRRSIALQGEKGIADETDVISARLASTTSVQRGMISMRRVKCHQAKMRGKVVHKLVIVMRRVWISMKVKNQVGIFDILEKSLFRIRIARCNIAI